MRKKILVLVIAALMVGSFCGAALCTVYSPPVQELKTIMTAGSPTLNDGETPDDGIPGGPPGTPG